MKKLTYIFFGLLMCSISFILSCKKSFLDEKPATNLNVPSSLSDLQLLLDNTQDINRSPVLGELAADDYYLSSTAWGSLIAPYQANSYIWAKDIFAGNGQVSDWDAPYAEVLTANVALEQLSRIDRNSTNGADYDNIKGSALFMRAFIFFDLAQVFALPYDKTTAGADLGIPIRLTADINVPSTRATLQATYDQIISDVLKAKSLLTVGYVKNYFNRPTKAAAYGFLSRIYLNMRNYEQAGLYADSALLLHSTLIDYNQISKTSKSPFPLINDELLYNNYLVGSTPTISIFRSVGYSIDTLLYRSYSTNDLRKAVYFSINGTTINQKGGYSGGRNVSNEIATDELYLNRAECYARAAKNDKALTDLNALLSNRYKTGTYIPFVNLSGPTLLNTIFTERRKELVMRGLRWNDIRRLNKEGFNITLTRTLNGKVYVLPPNDPRFVLPIPPDVIALSGIQQNNR
ncbi:hypothetical protein ABIB62_004555 [Mucilaginibacter sp. UYP25]|uniref:RagB/SusD family nutrient uptake outer membrane protein n=1 Tax=unclassified Mucilaginibacter TaxID=2617802 RepID=UPI00339928D0